MAMKVRRGLAKIDGAALARLARRRKFNEVRFTNALPSYVH